MPEQPALTDQEKELAMLRAEVAWLRQDRDKLARIVEQMGSAIRSFCAEIERREGNHRVANPAL